MIRKISIEIIFYLTKYCRNEILTVKESIIDFLNILKNDKDKNVKEACIQTLNYIEGKECNNNIIYSSIFNKNEKNNGNDVNISILESENEKNNSNENIPFIIYDKNSINNIK